MHAHLIPSYYLERVASTRTVTAGEQLRELAERLRTPLFEPDGAFGALRPVGQHQLKAEATKLAEVFQRSSSNVEGRNGYLSLRNHQLRGLDHPSAPPIEVFGHVVYSWVCKPLYLYARSRRTSGQPWRPVSGPRPPLPCAAARSSSPVPSGN